MTTLKKRSLWSTLALAGSAIGSFPISVAADQVLYAIDNGSPFLSVVNPLTGAEISFVGITVPGETINTGNGLAVNPFTNEMYAAVKLASQPGPGRNLILIDPGTGAATDIGNMGEPIASLAFTDTGVLYAVTGDCLRGCGGAATPETLFTVDTDTAALTFVQTLGNGDDGEAIAFNPNDGMMYHMSGQGAGMIFEKINLTTGTVTPIPLSGAAIDNEEAIGFTFDPAQNVFVGGVINWAMGEGIFGTVTPSGFLTEIAELDFPWKDYAYYDDAFVARRFSDVPPEYWAFSFVEALAASGVTSGCGNTRYCPEFSVTRAQMAVFLERGMRGSGYSPPAATGNSFLDVGVNDFAAAFIEQLLLDGITGGCGGNNYCPTNPVTRAQMAVFLLRAVHGAGYIPPAATGMFTDVPLGSFAVAWIEQLAAEGITSGCGGGNYCPGEPVTRAQMAVFLVRAFGL